MTTTTATPTGLPILSAGAHSPDEGKACVMEYVSLLAGEKWSDTPSCTYYPLARAAQKVNDSLSDADRHLLVPLIGRLFGTTAPVDDAVFTLRVARTVEHLSPAAKARNDVKEKYLGGAATTGEALPTTAAAYATAYATTYAAAYAATAYAATAYASGMDTVAWLASVIDIYDDLSGRTEHREITDADLRFLIEVVAGRVVTRRVQRT